MCVPEGWEQKKLQHITSLIGDGLHGTPNYSEDGKYSFINGNNLSNGKIVTYENTKKVNESEYQKYKKDLSLKTLLLSINGTIGNLGYFKGEDIVLGKSVAYLNLQDNVNQDYVYYVLDSAYMQNHFQIMVTGTTIKNLSLKTIRNTKILLPPLAEQEKIAEILSTWDHAIEQTEHLKANAETHKQALMQQLLTGKKRFPEFKGEWKEKALGNIVKISKGKALTSKNIVEGDYPVIAGGQTSPYNHNEYTHENVITVSASGAYAGFVAFHNYKIWASDCSVIEESKKVKILYIYYFLSFQQERIYTYQSGGAQPHIYPRDLAVMKIKLPSLEEQQKIAAVLNRADREIELLAQKLDHLKTEKRALMQQLLTGKRRVKVDG